MVLSSEGHTKKKLDKKFCFAMFFNIPIKCTKPCSHGQDPHIGARLLFHSSIICVVRS